MILNKVFKIYVFRSIHSLRSINFYWNFIKKKTEFDSIRIYLNNKKNYQNLSTETYNLTDR